MTKEALEILYKQRRMVSIGLAYFLVKNYTVAEDIVEDAFVKVFNTINDDTNPTQYLIITIKTMCYNYTKHINRKNRNHAVIFELTDDFIEAAEVKSELIDRMMKEIESLPGNYRETMRLYSQGYTAVQIGQILSTSHDTARTYWFRFKARMIKIFKKEFPNESLF